jgi:hypothetical protein
MSGHDDLSGEEKEKFEKDLVEKVKSLAQELVDTEGCNVTGGQVTTNTTGAVNVLS